MTVAISTMERPSALARCIGALLDGDTLPAELVIIDQSTDDATERIIGQVASSSAVHIVYVRQPRLGLAASRNAAIAASTRPIVTFTDDDCVPDSDWLTAISSTFETDQNADVVTGRILPLGPEQPGLYRIHAEARRGTTMLGTADRWMYVGGADREFADPRLNEGFLRRVARNSGGRYVRAAEAPRVLSWLQATVPQNAAPERRDLWHEPWAFALLVLLLSAEWILRRRWGLR